MAPPSPRRHVPADVPGRVEPQSGDQRPFSGDLLSSGVSPKVALSYRLPDQQLLYVSVEEGHRSGGFNTGGKIGSALRGSSGV